MSVQTWRAGWLLALLAALAACHTSGPAAPKNTVRTQMASGAPSPEVQASLNSEAVPALLLRPAGAIAVLSGTLSIDASYAIAAGAAKVLANNGGSVLAAGGGSLVSNNGGSLTGKVKSAGLVSDNGGGLVALASGNIIANNGGGVVSEHAGSLLSEHGAGIIANNGGGLTSKTKFGVLGVENTAYGAQVVAAGMQLQVVDMTNGKAVALGHDGKGKSVYAVYTNLAGGYEVYLPTSLLTNVRLVATIPGHDDPRVSYSALSAPSAVSPLAFDEDTAAVTRILRQSMRQKFVAMLVVRAAGLVDDIADEAVDGFVGSSGLGDSTKGLIKALLRRLFGAIRANTRISPADYADLGFLLGDVMLANGGNLPDIEIDQHLVVPADHIESNPLHQGKALANMASVLKLFREHIAAREAGNSPREVAQEFALKPYILRANDFHARVHPQDPRPYFVIEKATDLADFIGLEYFPLVAHQTYGCIAGIDCPSPPPKNAPKCDLITGCFPTGGIADLDRADGDHLAKAIATDMGLPPENVDILAIGAKSITAGLALNAINPELMNQLQCIIANYNQPKSVCDPATLPTP